MGSKSPISAATKAIGKLAKGANGLIKQKKAQAAAPAPAPVQETPVPGRPAPERKNRNRNRDSRGGTRASGGGRPSTGERRTILGA